MSQSANSSATGSTDSSSRRQRRNTRVRRPTSSHPAPRRMKAITARYDHCPMAQRSPTNMAAGVAIGSARAAGSVRGVPVGWASMARRAAAMSRGRPDVHIPRSRSDGSSVNALHASAHGVSPLPRLPPHHPALTRRPEDDEPAGSDVAEHVRDRIGRWQAGQRRAPPLAPEAVVNPAGDRRCERLRGVEGLGPVPPGEVSAVPVGPPLGRVADREHPRDARTAPWVDEDCSARSPLRSRSRQPLGGRQDPQRDEDDIRPDA